MRSLLLLTLLIPYVALCQTKEDYKIYSDLTNEKIIEWQKKSIKVSQLIITNNLTESSINLLSSSSLDLLDSANISYTYSIINVYDKDLSIIKFLSDENYRTLMKMIKNEINSKVNLKLESFSSILPINIITKEWTDRLFEVHSYKKVNKAWDKFYDKYPNSIGFFEFSKVFHSQDYAILYFVWRAKPLVGNGELIILRQNNGVWEKIISLNLWNN
jgi:hypothetical protein